MPIPESIKIHKPAGFGALEIRCFGEGKYYVYQVTSVYDEIKGRPRKKTGRSIGKITENDGFIPNAEGMRIMAKRNMLAQGEKVVRNHGAYAMLSMLSPALEESLRKHFPDLWREIKAFSLLRLVDKASPKMTPFHFEASSFALTMDDIAHGENSVRAFTARLGRMDERINAFLKDGIEDGKTLLFDGTSVFTRSADSLAEKGYNPRHSLNTQARILYVFESDTKKPVFYRIVQGSIVDRTAFMETIDSCGCNDCTIIADKGFYSKSNLSALMDAKLRFILPLQANTTMVDDAFIANPDDSKWDGCFSYHKRVIWFRKEASGNRGNFIYIFRDDERKQQIQTNMVESIEKEWGEGIETRCPKDILKEKRTGYYAMVSNIDTDAKEIFLSYKARWDIEQCFDYLKNDVAPFATYAHDNEYFKGMVFLNHIALCYYYGLVNAVRNSKLKDRFSPEEMIAMTKNIYIVGEGDRRRISEISGRTKDALDAIGVDITLKQ
jgi:Transposase